MWAPAIRQRLSADRLHFQHGPIDLVLRAWGEASAMREAEEAAWWRFQQVLGELAEELRELRQPAERRRWFLYPTACRMQAACLPFAPDFITPMTGVARLDKAYVNDGGDVAVHLARWQSLSLAVAGHYEADRRNPLSGSLTLQASDGVGGVATSGARGRSFSLGVADAVTVLARSAAEADAAATMIANAVDCEDARIIRRPAASLDPDSDLGERLVTVSVPPLGPDQIDAALQHGLDAAAAARARNLIIDAALTLQGETRVLGSHIAITGRAA
jgi:ApbE superfamily uncharacterized protein (UPF0280 family)